YYYYSRTEEGKQYPIYCRKQGSLDAAEQVTLDLNELGEGHKFFAVAEQAVSDDGHLLAYTTDTTGFRQYTLHVKNLDTGEILGDTAEKVGSIAWSADNKTLFYTVEDAAKRQYRMYRHRLGGADDVLVYEEPDEHFDLALARSRSEAFLFLLSSSHTTS